GGAPGAPGGDEANRERGDLAILDLTTGKVETVPKVKAFTLPDDLAVLVYHLDKDDEAAKAAEAQSGKASEKAKPEEPKPEASKVEEPRVEEPKVETPKVEQTKVEQPRVEEPKAEKPQSSAEPAPREQGGRRGRRGGPGAASGPGAAPGGPVGKKRKEGTTLVVRNLATGAERRIDDVVAYGLLRKNTWLWYHTSAKKPDSKKTYGLFATRLDGSETHALVEGFADFGGVASDRKGQVL